MIERGILDAVDFEDGVEGAVWGVMREFDAIDVVRRGAQPLGRGDHVTGRHIEKLRSRVDETRDQPWACDAVDLRPFARDPAPRRSAELSLRWQPRACPGRDPALQEARGKASRAQFRGDALADLMTVHAIDHDGTRAGQVGLPLRDVL